LADQGLGTASCPLEWQPSSGKLIWLSDRNIGLIGLLLNECREMASEFAKIRTELSDRYSCPFPEGRHWRPMAATLQAGLELRQPKERFCGIESRGEYAICTLKAVIQE
jgi:hypothetical protein